MTMQVNGLNQDYNYYNPYNTANIDNGANSIYGTSPYQPMTGFGLDPYNQPQFQTTQPAKTTEEPKKKMGFFEGIWHGIKGAVKAVVNTVKDIVTNPVKLLTTVAVGALCVFCPPVGVGLAVVGGAMGAVKIGKGIKDVTSAQTYEEQVAAAENIGAGALQVGLSVVGARAGVKAMSGVKGSAMAGVEKVGLNKATAKAWGTDMKAAITEAPTKLKYSKLGQSVDLAKKIEVGNGAGKIGSTVKGTVRGTVDTLKDTTFANNYAMSRTFEVGRFGSLRTGASAQAGAINQAAIGAGYTNFGMAMVPAAAYTMSNPNQGYTVSEAGIPLTYDTAAYNPYLY